MCYNGYIMKHIPKRTVLIWILLIIGFCAIEFPGVLIIKNQVYPFILGMPFILGYAVCIWVYLCLVLFYAWRTRWGRQAFFRKNRRQA